MKKRLFNISLQLIACSLSLLAQLPDFNILQFNEINNEPITNIYSMVEDDEGFLWFGGRYGLYRFDGTSFTPFYNDPANPSSIPFGTIIKIIKSEQGGLWLASDLGGFGYFDLKTQKAQCYGKDLDNPSGLHGERVQGVLEEPGGDLWVGTNNFTLHKLTKGANKFELFQPQLPEHVLNYALAGSLGEIISDSRHPDYLWIGSRFGIYHNPNPS